MMPTQTSAASDLFADQASWIVGPAPNLTLRRRASAFGRRDGQHADHLPGREGARRHEPVGASVRLGQPARPQPPGADGRPSRVRPAPLTELLDRLAGASPAPIGERLRRRFREQRAHLLQLVEAANSLGTLLSNALQAYQTEVSLPPERRHAPDLGLGGDRGGPDAAGRHLRNELPVPAGAGVARRRSAGAGHDGGDLPGLYRAFRRSGWLLPRWWRGETPMGRIRGSFTMQAAPRSSMIGPMLNTDNERGGRHGNPKDW
jgi:hypothetical protein